MSTRDKKLGLAQSDNVRRMVEWLDEYHREILPMRDAADSGDGTYDEYDQTYNVALEELHDIVASFVTEIGR